MSNAGKIIPPIKEFIFAMLDIKSSDLNFYKKGILSNTFSKILS